MDEPLVGRAAELVVLERTLADGGSLVVVGPAGVGKTRLGREAARLATRWGWQVETVSGFAAARSLAFGAVARLLPAVDAQDPHHLVTVTVARMRERATTTPVLLVVDDAQLLDPSSATLVHQLVVDGVVACVVTVRSGEPCPDPVVALWKDEHAVRVDVEPLDRAQTAALLAGLLGGDVAVTLEAEVWRLTRGNPLFLREIVAAGRADGTLHRHDGQWSIVGSLPTSARLADIIEMRLAALDTDDRTAIELIAVGEPLAPELARDILGRERLASLEHRGLLSVDRVSGAIWAGHPMYGEALRTSMPSTRRAHVAGQVADRLFGAGRDRPTDARLAAALLLDAGRAPPSDLAIEGARDALAAFDLDLAVRLAGHAAGRHPFSAHLIHGQALRLQGRGAESAAELAAAAAAARGEEQHARAAVARARNHLWVQDDLSAAQTTLEDVRDRLADGAWKATIEAELALQLATVGDFAHGRRTAEAALLRPGITPRAELACRIVSTLGQVLMLDLDGIDDSLDRGLELASELVAEEPLATDQLLLTRVEVMRYRDLLGCTGLVEERSRPGSPITGAWRMGAAMLGLLRGDVTGSVSASREALALLSTVDPFGNLPMVRGLLRVALAQRGEPAVQSVDADELHADEVRRQPRARAWANRALAWEAAARGALGSAVEQAVRGGREALERDLVGWGCDALHDAVRFGGADRVAEELAATTAAVDAPIPVWYGRHAVAAAAGDPDGLDAVGRGFAHAGARLLAAEAYAQAAHVRAAAGDDPAAARSAVAAQRLLELCPGAATPATADIEGLGLSARELEVAGLAAAGHSNREIAEVLVLSLRTVENHLSRGYGKLDVAGRDEVAALFE